MNLPESALSVRRGCTLCYLSDDWHLVVRMQVPDTMPCRFVVRHAWPLTRSKHDCRLPISTSLRRGIFNGQHCVPGLVAYRDRAVVRFWVRGWLVRVGSLSLSGATYICNQCFRREQHNRKRVPFPNVGNVILVKQKTLERRRGILRYEIQGSGRRLSLVDVIPRKSRVARLSCWFELQIFTIKTSKECSAAFASRCSPDLSLPDNGKSFAAPLLGLIAQGHDVCQHRGYNGHFLPVHGDHKS